MADPAGALASGGLYTVLSTSVRLRTAEIGVRVAFGAGRGRIFRMMIVQGVIHYFGLYILSRFVTYEPLFTAFGLQPSNHAALVLFSLLSGPFTFYLGPVMNFLSRKHEYEADRFAVITLGNGKPMEGALINLTLKNLSNLTPHPWYSAYHYSHPTATERIGAIRQIIT